jgi:hypothetical protein
VDEEGTKVGSEAPCVHPGCGRVATEIAVVDSAWEDTATGSALMVCAIHAETYVPATTARAGAGPLERAQDAARHDGGGQAAVRRAHRRGIAG